MSDFRSIPVTADFNLENIVDEIAQIYRTKGYEVFVYKVGNGITIEFTKNNTAFYNVIGIVEGVKVTLVVINGMLTVSFSEQKWSDKIIAFVLGWVCCWITWITGGIGLYNQIQLSNSISRDITLFVAN